jgi:hypothetical protein
MIADVGKKGVISFPFFFQIPRMRRFLFSFELNIVVLDFLRIVILDCWYILPLFVNIRHFSFIVDSPILVLI